MKILFFLFILLIKKLANQQNKINFDELLENGIRQEEFISEKNFKLIEGNFFEILTSQNGSRIVQSCLSKTSIEIITKIFLEIKPKLNNLIVHRYGNYFCKKFFCSLTDRERISFLESVFIFELIFTFFHFLDFRKPLRNREEQNWNLPSSSNN